MKESNDRLKQEFSMWDWDAVFKLLTQKCEEQGGEYKLSTKEAEKLKTGPIGIGRGEANLRTNVLPQYRERFPDFDFDISPHREYIRCRRRT